MKLINTDAQYDYYIDYLRYRSKNTKRQKTTQLYISSDSLAKILDSIILMIWYKVIMLLTPFLDGMNTGSVIKRICNIII
jgi:hypothetical protein